MADKLFFLFRYFLFYLKSGDAHSIHSPFVFDLYTKVIKPEKKNFYSYREIEKIRKELLSSEREISVTDFGAGSKLNNSPIRKIKKIARHAEKSPELAQLLFRLVNYFKPQVIFDLGTSFGLTTLYQYIPNKNAEVYTFEGCPEISKIARQNFKQLRTKNIQLIEGNIEDTLSKKINELPKIDYVFFDANHRYEPTIRYFELCLAKATTHSVFVFDDIHWSEEMEKAWKEIISHPQIMLSIDLFYIGIIFFRTNQPKQHFFLKL